MFDWQKDRVWQGIALGFLLHLIQLPVALFTHGLSLLFIGLSQLIYFVPAIVIASQKGRTGIAKGLIIGASLTFLLGVPLCVVTGLRE
jgi:hypothetical protein